MMHHGIQTWVRFQHVSTFQNNDNDDEGVAMKLHQTSIKKLKKTKTVYHFAKLPFFFVCLFF